MKSYWMQMTETDTFVERRETQPPEPGPQQLLVRLHAAGLNRGEFVLGHGPHGQAGSWKQIAAEGGGVGVSVGKHVNGRKPATESAPPREKGVQYVEHLVV